MHTALVAGFVVLGSTSTAFADCASPASPEGGLNYVDAATGFQYCDGTNWLDLGSSGSSLWTDNTTHISRSNFHILNTGLAAGSTTAGLDGNGIYAFFDPDKGVMRGGTISGGDDAWQDAGIGGNSFAWGLNAEAFGGNSVAFGQSPVATGGGSVAMGIIPQALNYASVAMGYNVVSNATGAMGIGSEINMTGADSKAFGSYLTTSGTNALALGNEATVSGNYSVAIGAGNASAWPPPIVSGNNSFGIFMGDQTGVDLATANTMAIMGGSLNVGTVTPTTDAQFKVAGTGSIMIPSGTDAQRPATGAAGMIRYNTDATTNDVIEYYDAESAGWIQLPTSSASGVFEVTGGAGTELVRQVAASAPLLTSDFVFGSTQLADTGNADHDARMFFDKSKGAFRAGSVTGTQWDDASVGTYSVAFGSNTTASGSSSVASGWNATASGSGSFAFGGNSGATASGKGAIAVGSSTQATADYAYALGRFANASVANAVAIGTGSQATADGAVSIGGGTSSGFASVSFNQATASGTRSFAFGSASEATANTAIAIGSIAQARAVGSLALGTEARVTATGTNSMAIGLGDSSTASYPQVSAANSFGIFMGNQNGVDLATANTMAIMGGSLNVGTVTPTTDAQFKVAGTGSIMIPSGTDAQRPATGAAGMVRYNSTATPNDKIEYYDAESAAWVQLADSSGSSLWTDNTTHITRGNFHVLNAGLAAGSTTAGLDGDGTYSFYDPDKGALRGGEVAFGEAGWQDTNIGTDSFAWGRAPRASGLAAVALGDRTRATGESSLAVGYDSHATNNQSIAMGDTVASNGWGSFAMGVETAATANHSVSFGLGDAAGARPVVSGASSFGIFMGDQSGIDLTQANTMSLMGGRLGIGTVTPSVELEVTGDIEYTGTITDVSDKRLKENITPLIETKDLLERLNKINTYSFSMKNDKNHRTEFGVMAQELETLFPELVHTAKDEMGTKSVNYVGLIAPIIEASKELKNENLQLKTELAEIKKDIDGLKIHTEYGIGKASFENILSILLGFGLASLLFAFGGFIRKRHD